MGTLLWGLAPDREAMLTSSFDLTDTVEPHLCLGLFFALLNASATARVISRRYLDHLILGDSPRAALVRVVGLSLPRARAL